MAPTVNWEAAILFYLLFILGILVIVVLRGLKSGSMCHALLCAALFVLINYAPCDLTNLTTIKDWPVMISVVEMAWGTTLSVIISYAGLMIGRQLGRLWLGARVRSMLLCILFRTNGVPGWIQYPIGAPCPVGVPTSEQGITSPLLLPLRRGDIPR
jgi:uncharacterized membrane protein